MFCPRINIIGQTREGSGRSPESRIPVFSANYDDNCENLLAFSLFRVHTNENRFNFILQKNQYRYPTAVAPILSILSVNTVLTKYKQGHIKIIGTIETIESL